MQMIPGVDRILDLVKSDPLYDTVPRSVLVRSIRSVTEDLRRSILEGSADVPLPDPSEASIMKEVRQRVTGMMALKLQRTINATGIIIHTNLGRSLLADSAVDNLVTLASRYSNLEFNLEKGSRGSRYEIVEGILCEISGAESAMVVNNNAAAVLLCLETVSKNKGVVVSRGELVEIGGSFRIPDVMVKSGAILREVGTTNRTHLRDYENAIDSDTGLLLKVHTSNYSVVGFTAGVPLEELVALGAKHQIPVMEDLGSGTLIDLSEFGITKEPTVQEAVAASADMVTFSGDKLLGGPQAGIILGSKGVLRDIKRNPLTRALRIDKLTLAALESTLRLYRDKDTALDAIPTLRMLVLPLSHIEDRARRLAEKLARIGHPALSVELKSLPSRAGGGSLPLMELPSKCLGVRIQDVSANAIERHMRENAPPVVARIEGDTFTMDMRTVQDDELDLIESAVRSILEKVDP